MARTEISKNRGKEVMGRYPDQMLLRMHPKLKRRLDALALAKHQPMTAFVRDIIAAAVGREDGEDAG